MFGKLGAMAKSLDNVYADAGDKDLLKNEEKRVSENKGVDTYLSKEDLMALEEDIKVKKQILDEARRKLEGNGPTFTTIPSAPTLRHIEEEKNLRPKDVISWVSTFDGSGNIGIFLREVQDALNHMKNWIDKKCVLRMIIANKILGQAKDLIGSQEADNWEEIKELLEYYYKVQDTPYTYLKEQRNKLLQMQYENVSSYARKFLDIHRRVLKAAGNKSDPSKAKFAQEAEEEEGVWRFIVGLTDKLNQRVENKNPRTLKEAISIALNAESLIQERSLCRKMSQVSVDTRARRPFENKRYDDSKRKIENPMVKFKSDSDKLEVRKFYCHYCKKTGHTEDRCYSKRQQDFRQPSQGGRPPPIRMLGQEEIRDQDQDQDLTKETEIDPYLYEHQDAMSSSYTSDQWESEEPFDF